MMAAKNPHSVRRIGRYEILAGLSAGGTAELYLAAIRGPGGFRKYVALKKLLGDVQRDPNFTRMFLDEARITALLTHPGIAQVFDLGEDGTELYIVMEFITGVDLGQLAHACKKQGVRVPFGMACRVIHDLCLALHYAHHFVDPGGNSSPIIHRDIAPKNVMVTFEGNVKVIDFGFALARGRLENTAVGTIKGTAGYVSPEQVLGKSLDARSDLYSAGVLLWEALSSQRAFTGKTRLEILQKIIQAELPPLKQLNPEVPSALSEVVVTATHKERSQRFATGREMARAIELAAGKLLYDDARSEAFMREMFRDKLTQTRALFPPT